MTNERKKTLKALNEGSNGLIFPLQFFAEDENTEDKEKEELSEDSKETEQDKPETFTRPELDSAISKAVNSALRKKEKEFQSALEKAQKDGIIKGQTYAELTEEQKKQKDIEEREQKILEKERELLIRERISDITADLKEQNLPVNLASLLAHEEDDTKVKEMIETIKTTLTEEVKKQVSEKLSQSTPKSMGNEDVVKSIGEEFAVKHNAKVVENPFFK